MLKSNNKKKCKKLLKLVSISLIAYILSGCVASVKCVYNVQKPPVSENKVIVNSKFFFSISDLRKDPGIIGYLTNMYGMPVTTVKSSNPSIPQSIYPQFRDELTRKGFLFTDDEKSCD
jgi:uncharacterized lipoprotein YajG